jgi:hypothetical protein
VRVRLPRVEDLDLNLFDFDYDLTFMVFFLNAEDKVYARYGGRDATSPDARQSLAGLHYTMESVLAMHAREDKAFAPRSDPQPKYIRDLQGVGRFGRCLHCHQVRQILDRNMQKLGSWRRDLVWRYPLPENLGLELEVDRGNVVHEVKGHSPAADSGLKAGDRLTRLNGVPLHSQADVQFALDRAPAAGSIDLAWQRGKQHLTGSLALPAGWRQTDISWRHSVHHLVASARLYGKDLTPEERKALGLSAEQLAFRQQEAVPLQARAAGVKPGDIIVGIDNKQLTMDVLDFLNYVQRTYLVGDKATLNVLRNGKQLDLEVTFVR